MSVTATIQPVSGQRRAHAVTLRQLRAVRLGAVDMLAAGVAHEVNNPLAFVTANVGLLGQGLELCIRALRGEALGDTEREDLRFMLDEGPAMVRETADGCARIGEVVRRLAAFSERGGEQPVDLGRIVADVARVLRSGARRLEVEVEVAQVPALRGNPARVAHAVFTFIEHARESAARRPDQWTRIGVRLAPGDLGAAVVLEVWDSGPALTPEQRAVFEDPFSATGPDRTVALGLALATEIVREHGGAVALADRPEGGTVRRIVLPAAGGVRP